MTGPQDFLADWCATYQRRRDVALQELAGIAGLSTQIPGGAFYLMPHCGALLGRSAPDGTRIDSSSDLAAYLMDHGVVVVPGPGFSCDPFFRMSVATSEDNIVEGIKRMKSAIEKLS